MLIGQSRARVRLKVCAVWGSSAPTIKLLLAPQGCFAHVLAFLARGHAPPVMAMDQDRLAVTKDAVEISGLLHKGYSFLQ